MFKGIYLGCPGVSLHLSYASNRRRTCANVIHGGSTCNCTLSYVIREFLGETHVYLYLNHNNNNIDV